MKSYAFFNMDVLHILGGFRAMADLYYCVKCKKKTEIKDAQHVTMKNGKPALKGQCAVCGTTVNAILGTKKAV
jgi:hypothetical protein